MKKMSIRAFPCIIILTIALISLHHSKATSVEITSPFAKTTPIVRQISGDGEVHVKINSSPDPFRLNALHVSINASKEGFCFWIPTDLILPDNLDGFYYWARSRGSPWTEPRIVLQTPDGSINTYQPHSFGDSPWARTQIQIPAPEEALDTLGQAIPDQRWHFRGWWFNYKPFQKGTFQLGSVEFPTEKSSISSKASWTLRDIDESIRFQGAYTGFNLSYDGETLPIAIPKGLLVDTSNKSLKSLRWEILTREGLRIQTGTENIAGSESGELISLATLPVGSYWWNWQAHKEDGSLDLGMKTSIIVSTSEVNELETPLDLEALHRIWPESTLGEVNVDLSEFRGLHIPVTGTLENSEIEVSLTNGFGQSVEPIRRILVNNENNFYWVPEAALEAGMRYELDCTLYVGNQPIDKRTLSLLVGPPPLLPDSLLQSAPTYRENRINVSEVGAISIYQPELRSKQLSNIATTGNIPLISLNWNEIEPQRGFYQWKVMDDIISEAIYHNLNPTFTVYSTLDHLPRWLWYEQLLDQELENKHYAANYIRKASPSSKTTLEALENTIRNLVVRYRDVPGISAWNFSQGVESFWSDASRKQRVVDYSQATGQLFAEHLQSNGWSLEEVSKALEVEPLSNWDAVLPPQPIFSDTLDLRPIWLEWQNFKQSYPAKYFDAVIGAARTEDPSRPIHQYAGMGAGDLSHYLPVFKEHHADLAFGAGGSLVAASLQSITRQHGVPMQAEPSGVPPSKPDLAVTTFIKLAHGMSVGDVNVMWGRFFNTDNTETIQAVAETTELLNTLPDQASEPVDCGIAVGFGMQSIINRTRSFMWIDWVNANAYGYSSAHSSTLAGSASTGYVTEHCSSEILSEWPAIVWLEAPLLDDGSAERIAAHIYSGGKAILCGDTGRYDEAGQESWTLKTLLQHETGDESIQKHGQGHYQWLNKPITWGNWDARMRLELSWLNPTRVVRTSTNNVWLALRKIKDESRYLVVALGKNWRGGTPRIDDIDQTQIAFTLSLPTLPAKNSWQIRALSESESKVLTSSDLYDGIPLSVGPAEVKVWSIEAL